MFYHRNGQQGDNEKQGIKFFFGDNLNCIQIGKGYLGFAVKNRKNDKTNSVVAHCNTNDVI